MSAFNKFTYICIPCRFTSKYSGYCPHCREWLLGMYDLDTPKKRDDRGWKKIELTILEYNSNIQLCSGTCCVPIRSSRKSWAVFGSAVYPQKKLTLSQQKARLKKRRLHHQGEVPQYHGYR
jgi:hypothetical protein